jgi:DNA-directed RNA polymerase subunit RPC12/RpoP
MGRTYTQPLVWWRHEGINNGFYASQIPADGAVKCLACNSNNWTDNGEHMNQYECATCGAFITTEPKNDADA